MSQKIQTITGWVLTGVLGLLFAVSAFMKLSQDKASVDLAATLGISAGAYLWIGIIEILSLILFIIPRTGFIGGLFLIAYMGGAIATHLEHNDSIAMAVGVQIVLWIALFLRFPETRQRILAGK